MTPLPKPTAHLRRMRADNPIPMTANQYLRWRARRRITTMSLPTDAEVDAGLRKIMGRPYPGDRIAAVDGTPPTDEMDAGFYGALRLGPRKVGAQPDRVPWPVSNRLYDAGLVRKVDLEGKPDSQDERSTR